MCVYPWWGGQELSLSCEPPGQLGAGFTQAGQHYPGTVEEKDLAKGSTTARERRQSGCQGILNTESESIRKMLSELWNSTANTVMYFKMAKRKDFQFSTHTHTHTPDNVMRTRRLAFIIPQSVLASKNITKIFHHYP